jgi:DNA-binding Lrp family transcriptional regulator
MKSSGYIYRRGESKAEFLSWVAIIAAKSPGLRLPSPKNGDPRNPFSPKAAATVWKRVGVTLRSPGSGALCNVTLDVVSVLETIVERRGLNPLAFAVSYRDLGRALGIHPEVAHRRVKAIVEAGKLVILDRGTQGEKGLPTMYCLPNRADPAAARDHHAVVARKAKRAEYEAEQAALAVAQVIPPRPAGVERRVCPVGHATERPRSKPRLVARRV